MAVVTVTWDSSVPVGSEDIKTGDNRIVELKGGLVQRLRNGGHRMPTIASADASEGFHCCGEMYAADTGHTTAALAGEFYLFAADGVTVVATLRDSTAATPSELFLGANKLRTTGNVTAATGTFSGAVATGALTATGHIKPTTDDLYDLGDLTHRIKNAWFSGTVKFDGAVQHAANEVFSAGIQVGGNGTSPQILDIVTSQYTAWQDVTTGTNALSILARMVLGKLVATTTVTLPAAAVSTGREVTIAHVSGAFGLIIDPNASELINGAATLTLDASAGKARAVHILCDGTGWVIVGTYTVGT